MLKEALDDARVHHLVLVHLADLRTYDVLGKALHCHGALINFSNPGDSDIPVSRSICSSSVRVSNELRPDCDARTCERENALTLQWVIIETCSVMHRLSYLEA